MKKLKLLLCVIVLLPAAVSAEETYGILGFKSTSITEGELDYINAVLEKVLLENQNKVISISDREKILEKIKFSFSGATEEDKSGSNFESIAASHLIAGTAGIISENQAYIIIKKIDTVSGQTESAVRRLENDFPSIIDNMELYYDALVNDNTDDTTEEAQLLPDRYLDQKDPYKLGSAFIGTGIFNQKYTYNISGIDGRLGFTNFFSEKLGFYLSFSFGWFLSMNYNEYGAAFSWSNIHYSTQSLFGLGYRFELLPNLIFVPGAGALLSVLLDVDPGGLLNMASISVGAATDLNLYYYLNDRVFLQLQLTCGITFIPLMTLSFLELEANPAGFGKLSNGLMGGISIGIGFSE